MCCIVNRTCFFNKFLSLVKYLKVVKCKYNLRLLDFLHWVYITCEVSLYLSNINSSDPNTFKSSSISPSNELQEFIIVNYHTLHPVPNAGGLNSGGPNIDNGRKVLKARNVQRRSDKVVSLNFLIQKMISIFGKS